VLTDAHLKRLEALIARLDAATDRAQRTLNEPATKLRGQLTELVRAVQSVRQPTLLPSPATAAPRERLTPPKAVGGSRPVPPARPAREASADGVTPARQKILNALAFFSGIGVAAVDKTQLALMVGVSPTSGGYFNNLGALRTSSLVHYPSGGTVALTDAGAAIASTDGIPETTAELHQAIRTKLPPAKWRILEVLIETYPKPITKDDLAAAIDVSPTSGGYFNNLGALRSLGLIDYPQPGHVAAQPVLFLEGR
jgi:Mn-dependent DtxR family transcriptional regulator